MVKWPHHDKGRAQPSVFGSKNTEKWNPMIQQEPFSFFFVFVEYKISDLQGKILIKKWILECTNLKAQIKKN